MMNRPSCTDMDGQNRSTYPDPWSEAASTDATTATDKLAESKKKKDRFWHQRDSMVRREKLLIGKEGSRRRQRWDNNHFTHHPLGALDTVDMRPPGYGEHHNYFLQWFYDGVDVEEDINYHRQLTKSTNRGSLNRHQRQILIRSRIPEDLVAWCEDQLWSSIDSAQDGHEDNGALIATLEIANNFARYITHLMCRFYGIHSFSETLDDGRRVTHIHGKPIQAMPKQSFYNYLFFPSTICSGHSE